MVNVTLDGWDKPNTFAAHSLAIGREGTPVAGLEIRWNGWAVPLFTREQADAIMARVNDDPDVHTMAYDPEADSYVYLVTGESVSLEDGLDEFGAIHHDDVTLYPIGSFAWTWQVVR